MSRSSDLVKAMVDIRDQDRLECGRHLFELLGYGDSAFITEPQLDELLLKTVRKRLGTNIYADMVLMAFGLLPGYKYTCLSVGDRRVKFLRESNWLKVNQKSKIKDFDSAGKKEQDDVLDSLRNTEKYWMGKIADEFVNKVKLKDKDGKEIQDALKKYVELLDSSMDEVRDVAGSIIDYVPKATVLFPPDTENDTSSANELTGSEETTKQNVSEEDPRQHEPDKDPPPTPIQRNSVEGTDSHADNNIIVVPQTSTHASTDSDNRATIPANVVDPSPSVQPPSPSPPEDNRWSKLLKRVSIILVPVLVLLSGLCLVFGLPPWHHDNLVSSQEQIGVSETQVTIGPTNVYQLAPIPLTDDISNEPFEYSSENPNILSVSPEGYVTVFCDLLKEDDIAVDVTITRGNATKTVTFSIKTDGADTEFVPVDLDNFKPAYTLTQQVRLVGSNDWSDSVDAKVGDKVEFWIQYRNTSSEDQMNVMIRDVLPQSLRYINGTTKLWSADYNGFIHNENTITTTGFNIGHYAPNANAHVRFQAEVVEDGLVCGHNTLGNWAQASAAGVNMQNATTVKVNKSE